MLKPVVDWHDGGQARRPAADQMIDSYKQLIANQYEAALCMLSACIDRCPDATWSAPIVELTFNQAVFHTLFFTDLYLGLDVPSQRGQPFHRDHAEQFADYEELEPRRQQASYEKPFVRSYLQHCRDKAAAIITSETAESLAAPVGFDWLPTSHRAELHVYNIRHIHHHAAQLSLYLRMHTGDGVPWVGSGWKETGP